MAMDFPIESSTVLIFCERLTALAPPPIAESLACKDLHFPFEFKLKLPFQISNETRLILFRLVFLLQSAKGPQSNRNYASGICKSYSAATDVSYNHSL